MLNKKQLAKELNVSISTINKLMVEGVPRIKIGKSVRFELADVKNWLKERNK